MKTRLVALLTAAVAALLSLNAAAALVVDTGEPTYGRDSPGDPILASYQGLAAQFVLSERHRITGVTGFISSAGSAGSITVAIYADGGEVPGQELLLASAAVPAVTFTDDGISVPGWYGPEGLDWLLGAGTYWVAFEVRAGQNFEGYMANPAPNPLQFSALSVGGIYTPESNFGPQPVADLGIRIYGDAVPVPEPTSLALGLLGLAAAAVVRIQTRRPRISARI